MRKLSSGRRPTTCVATYQSPIEITACASSLRRPETPRERLWLTFVQSSTKPSTPVAFARELLEHRAGLLRGRGGIALAIEGAADREGRLADGDEHVDPELVRQLADLAVIALGVRSQLGHRAEYRHAPLGGRGGEV